MPSATSDAIFSKSLKLNLEGVFGFGRPALRTVFRSPFGLSLLRVIEMSYVSINSRDSLLPPREDNNGVHRPLGIYRKGRCTPSVSLISSQKKKKKRRMRGVVTGISSISISFGVVRLQTASNLTTLVVTCRKGNDGIKMKRPLAYTAELACHRHSG